MVMNFYFDLLKEWCDKLEELQIKEGSLPELSGGILCPSCARVHGRCSDAMYPMLYLYRMTGEKKYKDCAMRLFSWSDNMYHEEGFFYNDTNSSWRGITVFAAACMGECLLDFGSLLTKEEYGAVLNRFVKCAGYLKENIERIGGNINYPVTCAYTMAVAHALTKEEEYGRKAHELAQRASRFFTEDGLLYGEGHNRQEVSPKGCRPVDIGYNIEESLPALLLYAMMEKDEKIHELAVNAMRLHLEFMLPDGAWDNSFGTRNYKWSYWGSRTSDGCLTGFGLAEDPVLEEAVRRNALLLKKCTSDGLLYGGPMFHSAGEPPCVHHTFCHAKAFALLLQKASDEQMERLNCFQRQRLLPSDQRNGIRFFASVHTLLLGKGNWRATVTGYDVEYCRFGHPSGGAVSLLWHERLGPVLVGTMGNYELVEPNNMQLLRRSMPACLTPRIEYEEGEKLYRNIYDQTAGLRWEETEDALDVWAEGIMTASDGSPGEPFCLNYRMTESGFEISAHCIHEGCRLIVPVVSEGGESVFFDEGKRRLRIVRKAGAGLVMDAAFGGRMTVDRKARDFSPVGGMQAVRAEILMSEKGDAQCGITAQVPLPDERK